METPTSQVTEPTTSNIGFLAPVNAPISQDALDVIKQRFLQNFEYVELERYIDPDMSGHDKKPVEHDHIRFRMCGEDREKMNPRERLVYLSRQIDRGKYLLAKYGIKIEEAHVDESVGVLAFNADFEHLPEGVDKDAALTAVTEDLQQGLKAARASRKQAVEAAK